MAGAAPVHVEVVWSPAARELRCVALELTQGATAADALAASGAPWEEGAPPRVGVWGRRCALDQVLQEGDRVELYRPLELDPKEARRQRARRSATTGTRRR